jgi:hypothetical protein
MTVSLSDFEWPLPGAGFGRIGHRAVIPGSRETVAALLRPEEDESRRRCAARRRCRQEGGRGMSTEFLTQSDVNQTC